MTEAKQHNQGGPPTPTLSPAAALPPLSASELDVLHRVGREWQAALGGTGPRTRTLPVDPGLCCPPRAARPTRFGRLAPVEMFQPHPPGELVTPAPVPTPRTPAGRALGRIRRMLLGPPLASSAVVHERMRKLVALPLLSSDLLSSVAYGPEALVTVLVLAGAAALTLSLPLAAGLIVLMIITGLSYRQTVAAYPHGAGSYIVASDNLGSRPGLVAAVGLMLDYILTVAVSVSAGVSAITSALPRLAPLSTAIGVLVIAVLLAGNLRGVRAAGNIFAAPTYAFLLALGLLIVVGVAQAARRGFTPLPPPPIHAAEGLGLLLVLRAFSSGATSMTGIEAVSNAVPAFRPVEWRNARTTLTWMIGLLVAGFAGLTLLIHLDGLIPRTDQTMLSQLAQHTFHRGLLYSYVQAATALILLLAANTAFNDFPRLLFFMARNCHAPRAFLHMGDRLAFSNGIIALAVAAAVIFLAFGGRTFSLIPLYAVGVFLAFTLSQAGMVVHWRRHRGPRWRVKLGLNALGALLSGLVLVTAAISKFAEGAWVVVVAVPLLVLLALRIRHHYDMVAAALALRAPAAPPGQPWAPVVPTGAWPAARSAREAAAEYRAGAAAAPRPDVEQESADVPQEVGHLVVVPVARLDQAALRALAYAVSLGQPIFALHISPDDQEDEWFHQQWNAWGDHVRLEIVVSPYRAVIPTLARYIEALHASRPDLTLTVILPEIVTLRRWQQLLHSRSPRRLRRALRALPGIVITSVPVHVAR